MKPDQFDIDNKKPPIIPKNTPIPPQLKPLTEPTSYPEDIYNINYAQKRKPTMVECNEPDTASDEVKMFPRPPVGFKTQITIAKPVQQESPLEKKWKENLISNIQNERPKLKPVEVKDKPSPANALLNKPTNAEIKQSFIEKFIKPLEAADVASKPVSVPSMYNEQNSNESFFVIKK